MKRYLTIGILLVLAGFAGCSGCNPTYISHDYDPDAEFGAYRTFGWIDQTTMEDNRQAMMNLNPLVESRIKRAVNEGLAAKGLVLDESDPDLLLMYHVGVQSVTEIRETGYGYGWGGYGGGNVRADQFEEGTFMLDMVDTASQQLVWRGIAEGVLEENPSPASLDKSVNDMITRLLQKFPPPER
jgi:hypothetical protein